MGYASETVNGNGVATITGSGHSISVKVWSLTNLKIKSEHDELKKLLQTCNQYYRSRLTVTGDWICENDLLQGNLLNSIVKFTVTGDSVEIINGVVYGRKAGTSTITTA